MYPENIEETEEIDEAGESGEMEGLEEMEESETSVRQDEVKPGIRNLDGFVKVREIMGELVRRLDKGGAEQQKE